MEGCGNTMEGKKKGKKKPKMGVYGLVLGDMGRKRSGGCGLASGRGSTEVQCRPLWGKYQAAAGSACLLL